MKLGLDCSPGFQLTSKELSELNPPFLRSILYSFDDISALQATNKPLIITLNNQCREVGGDWSGWDNAVFNLQKILGDQLVVLGCGNEFDLYWQNNSKDVPPEFAADIARRASRLLRTTNTKVAATSVASGRWPEYLELMANLCRNDVNYFDIHPYGKRPDNWGQPGWMFGDLRECITTARQICGKDIICTEYGVKIGDAGTPQEVANFMQAAHSTLTQLNVNYVGWFAYTDLNGAPSERGQSAFGLKSETNSLRPAWYTYAELNKATEVVVPTQTLDRWRQTVGAGLLDAMQKDGTSPAQRASTWLPLGVTPSDIEECIGKNGVRYTWLLTEGKLVKYNPSN